MSYYFVGVYSWCAFFYGANANDGNIIIGDVGSGGRCGSSDLLLTGRGASGDVECGEVIYIFHGI